MNASILHPTIVGSKVCRTYDPPAKTEMRADPVAWPAVSLKQCSLEIMTGVIISTNVQFQLTISLNSSEIITYVIYIHDKTMTTADYGGKLPKFQDDSCCLFSLSWEQSFFGGGCHFLVVSQSSRQDSRQPRLCCT